MNNIAVMQGARYTDAMNAAPGALGAYLSTLRERRGLEPKDLLPRLTQRLGKTVDHSRLWRAENGAGTRWPEGDFLTALLDLIGGDLRDIAWIQNNPQATAEDGQQLAIERMRAVGIWTSEDDDIIRRIGKLSLDQRRVIQDLLDTWKEPE